MHLNTMTSDELATIYVVIMITSTFTFTFINNGINRRCINTRRERLILIAMKVRDTTW